MIETRPEILEGRDYFGYLHVDRRIKLESRVQECGSGSSGSGQKQGSLVNTTNFQVL
jgi:hypothetical protein